MKETGQIRGRENGHVDRMPNRKYAYFRDDQIIFVVKHQATLTADEQARQYKDFTTIINTELRRLYGRDGHESPDLPNENPLEEDTPQDDSIPGTPLQSVSPSIQRRANPPQVSDLPDVIAFPELTVEEKGQVEELAKHKNDKGEKYLTPPEVQQISSAFSIAIYDLKDMPPDPASLMTLVQALRPRLAEQLKSDPIPGFDLQGTLLNWLTSIASQSGGTGGPGGRPFPYIGNRKTAPYRFSVEKQLKEKNIYGSGSGVDVVILDTAPCAQDLVAAYKELPDHPLVPTLLGPEGKLHLYPATYEDQLRMTCTSLNEHDYKMTDHGLFIAGIVHSIVPDAEIHLIEVLNPYGVGDLWSFVKGLITLFTKIYDPHRKMVVNCSWVLEFPRDDLQARHKDKNGDPDARFAEIIRMLPATEDQSLSLILEFLLSRLYGLGRQAVAAAGNDSKKEEEKVQARYPAAFKRVAGVGALPVTRQKRGNGKFMASTFSNLSDTPERNGIATFGGEAGEGKGVLGLYIGEFPCCRNESKWAWWAGTSFATPILTAAIASVLSATDIKWTPVALNKLYGATDVSIGSEDTETTGKRIIQDSKVREQEDAFLVVQS